MNEAFAQNRQALMFVLDTPHLGCYVFIRHVRPVAIRSTSLATLAGAAGVALLEPAVDRAFGNGRGGAPHVAVAQPAVAVV